MNERESGMMVCASDMRRRAVDKLNELPTVVKRDLTSLWALHGSQTDSVYDTLLLLLATSTLVDIGIDEGWWGDKGEDDETTG